MLYVNFNLDRIKAAIATTPESSNFMLHDHDKILDDLRNGNPASLPLEERLIVFSYIRHSVYTRANEQGHFIDQLHLHPFEGLIRNNAICEPLYNKEIGILQKITDSIDYSDALKNKIATITESVFDELLTIEKFREDFLYWDHISIDKKIAAAYGFLWVFNEHAQNIFPWPNTKTDFYLEDREDFQSITMAAMSAPLDSEDAGKHLILGNINVINKMSPQNFFSSLHHECIHNLLFQMMWSYRIGACTENTYQADATLKSLSIKHLYTQVHLINSVYFNNHEELICYSNDFRAHKKLLQLTPSKQISYCHNTSINPASP